MLFYVTLFLALSEKIYYVPHYIIFHFIFSFYQGTAYLANPSEIPFLISHSRMVILYSMTALDITYLPKLQITWEESIFLCLRMPWLYGDFILCFPCFLLFPKWLKKMHKKYHKDTCIVHTITFFFVAIPFCIVFLQTFGYSYLPPLFIQHSDLTT